MEAEVLLPLLKSIALKLVRKYFHNVEILIDNKNQSVSIIFKDNSSFKIFKGMLLMAGEELEEDLNIEVREV